MRLRRRRRAVLLILSCVLIVDAVDPLPGWSVDTSKIPPWKKRGDRPKRYAFREAAADRMFFSHSGMTERDDAATSVFEILTKTFADARSDGACDENVVVRKCVSCAAAWYSLSRLPCERSASESAHASVVLVSPGFVSSSSKYGSRHASVFRGSESGRGKKKVSFDFVLSVDCDVAPARDFTERLKPLLDLYDVRVIVPSHACSFVENNDDDASDMRLVSEDRVVRVRNEDDGDAWVRARAVIEALRSDAFVVFTSVNAAFDPGFFVNVQAFVTPRSTMYAPDMWSEYRSEFVRAANCVPGHDGDAQRCSPPDTDDDVLGENGGMWNVDDRNRRTFAMHAGDARRLLETMDEDRCCRARSLREAIESMPESPNLVVMKDRHAKLRWHRPEEDCASQGDDPETRRRCFRDMVRTVGSKIALSASIERMNRDQIQRMKRTDKRELSMIKSELASLVDILRERDDADASVVDELDSFTSQPRGGEEEEQEEDEEEEQEEDLSQSIGVPSSSSSYRHHDPSSIILLFTARAVDVESTIQKALFYASCGFDTMVAFRKSSCPSNACVPSETPSGVLLVAVSDDDDDDDDDTADFPSSAFMFAVLEWLSSRDDLLVAHDLVVAVEDSCLLSPHSLMDWAASTIESGCPYSGKHAVDHTHDYDGDDNEDSGIVAPYCNAHGPVAFSVDRLIRQLGRAQWRACRREGSARDGFVKADVEMGACVYRNLHMGCNEGMSRERSEAQERRLIVTLFDDALQERDDGGGGGRIGSDVLEFFRDAAMHDDAVSFHPLRDEAQYWSFMKSLMDDALEASKGESAAECRLDHVSVAVEDDEPRNDRE